MGGGHASVVIAGGYAAVSLFFFFFPVHPTSHHSDPCGQLVVSVCRSPPHSTGRSLSPAASAAATGRQASVRNALPAGSSSPTAARDPGPSNRGGGAGISCCIARDGAVRVREEGGGRQGRGGGEEE